VEVVQLSSSTSQLEWQVTEQQRRQQRSGWAVERVFSAEMHQSREGHRAETAVVACLLAVPF